MTYGFNFTIGTANAKTAQIISDALAQFFDDERIHFECYCDAEQSGVWFFGLYGTDDDELFKKDSKVFKAMMDYANIFDEAEEGPVAIDERIELSSFQEFQESLDEDEYETAEDSLNIMDELLCDESESDEETSEAKYSTVVFDPNMIANTDGDIINEIKDYVFENMKPGHNSIVINEDSLEADDLFEKLVVPGILEAMKR